MNAKNDCSGEPDRRRGGRVICTLTKCQYGEIVNISKTGLRVISRKLVPGMPPGASLHMHINAAGRTMTVCARAVHNRPRPDGMFEVGFQFVGITDEQARDLIDLARTAFDGRVMHRKAAS